MLFVVQHQSWSAGLICLVNRLNTSMGDRHYLMAGALIPDHTPGLYQSCSQS